MLANIFYYACDMIFNKNPFPIENHIKIIFNENHKNIHVYYNKHS